MFNYAPFEILANSMVNEFGSEVLLIRPGLLDETVYPPANGAETGFVFEAVQTKLDFMDRQGGNTEAGSIKFLLSLGDTAPTVNDSIKAEGRRYGIDSVDRVAPNGQPLLWKVIASGGVADTQTYLAGAPLVGGTGGSGDTLTYPYTLGVPDEIDETNDTYFYWGWVNVSGGWLIRRILTADSTYEEANNTSDPEHADLAAAWPDRLNLAY